ncbi:MAG: type II toxin-antitoxin system VapC family toxin [Nitrospinae bacterium]|nr:type II toxin-antitoxin system VapC family toxin [Nitrospinota bacterium]
MGLIEELLGNRVCIDSSPIIYFIEKDPKFHGVLHPIFTEINAGNVDAITSTIALLEVLVLPFKTDNKFLTEKYREILLNSKGFSVYEVTNEISELAARLRAKYGIRTPDAILVATSIHYGARAFLTNDSTLKNVIEIKVLVLDDFSK